MRVKGPGPHGHKPAVLRVARIAAFVACVGLSASACASAEETGTLAHRVKVWETGTTYTADVQAVEAAVAHIEHDIATHAEPGVVAFDCVTLGQDANMDYSSTLPTPDQTFSTDLGNAYAAYLQYASDCRNGYGAPATIATNAHYLTTGNQELAAAQARSRAILH